MIYSGLAQACACWQSDDGESALYLAVSLAAGRPRNDPGLRFFNSPEMQARTFGVFTQCDRLRASEEDEKRDFVDRVLETDAKKLEDKGRVTCCVCSYFRSLIESLRRLGLC